MRSFVTFVLLPIFMASIGEFGLKTAINKMTIAINLHSLVLLGSNPLIWLGSACIIGAGIMWVVAMSRYQLSFIYPFFSLNFILILIGSRLFLGEEISLVRYLAVVLIIIGLIFISRSKFSESKVG